VSLCEFVSELTASAASGDIFHVAASSATIDLPVKLFARPSEGLREAPLVVTFHGGVNRERRSIPVFQSTIDPLDGRATVLALADPTLSLAPDLAQAWYAGSASNSVPATIAELLDAVIERLEPSRLVFASGSAGGHPALFHSFYRPGSICLVQNALSCISRYERHHNLAYRKACWAELEADAPLSSVIQDDVGQLYRRGHQNSVIWLQNALDPLVPRQLAFFMRDVVARENFLLMSEYFPGFSGHSYPRRVWAAWIQAAVDAPTASVGDVAAAASPLLAAILGGRHESPAPLLGDHDMPPAHETAAPDEGSAVEGLAASHRKATPAEGDFLRARDMEIASLIASWSTAAGARG
jgi:hypothetical protein